MKLSKTKQVIGGLVLGFILIGIIAVASDDTKDTKDKATTEQTESKTIADNSTAVKAPVEDADAATTVETTDASAPVLFETSNDFRTSFNNFCKGIDVSMRAGKAVMNEGEVNNTFTSSVSEHISLIGTINKANNTVKEITMIGMGDGTASSGADIVICMGSLIGTVEPSLTGDERMAVLKKLGLFTDEDVMNLSKTYDHNGLHYSITSSDQMGIWFAVTKK